MILLNGCVRDRIVELKKEHLFSIPIGHSEEEIGILRENNGRFLGPEHVLFRNGFFFTVDTVNQKIMKITTPGDVILIIADGSMEEENAEERVLKTKQKRYYDFNQIGNVAVDSENNLYVEDIFLQKTEVETVIDIFTIDDGSIGDDGEYEETYRSHILKFDRLGSFIQRIGTSGVDTEPFYYIYKIDVDRDGNLIVLTGDDDWQSWTYYRFSPEGKRLEKRNINTDELEIEEHRENRASFVMDVVPSHNPHEVVYWLSYYETSQDSKEMMQEEELWGEEIEIEDYNRARQKQKEKEEGSAERSESIRDLVHYDLLFYDLEKNAIATTHTWERGRGNQIETTEEFIGLDSHMNCFFWKYIDRNKSVITILRPDGSFITKRSFLFEDDGIWMCLQIAPDGSISAIKADEWNVHYYRWRSDKLISNKHEKLTFKEFFFDKVEGFKNANR
jgi:hypothetical protein